MTLYKAYIPETEKITYPVCHREEEPYSYISSDMAFGQTTLEILSLIADYRFLSIYQIIYLFEICVRHGDIKIGTIKNILSRLSKKGLIMRAKLYSSASTKSFNGFYRGDWCVYYLTPQGINFVKSFKAISPAQETKLRRIVSMEKNKDGRKGSMYLMHSYGTYCIKHQLMTGFWVNCLNTSAEYEALPVDYSSQEETAEAEEGGEKTAWKRKVRGKGFFFDCMVTAGKEDGSKKWYVFGEYDRRTESSTVLKKKLASYCSSYGYISALEKTDIPSVGNACIVMACDSAEGYHDGPALNESRCKKILTGMRHGTITDADVMAIKELSPEGYLKTMGYSFPPELVGTMEELLDYYTQGDDDVTETYELVERHIKSLSEGYNPMRIDTVLDREKFFTLKRLIAVFGTFAGEIRSVADGKYFYDGSPNETVSLMGGLSCYFLPAVAVGYDACTGVFTPDILTEQYRELVNGFIPLKGSERYAAVSRFSDGGIVLEEIEEPVYLNMRNTFYLEKGYAHVEDLADLGAWLRVGTFLGADPDKTWGHSVILLADDAEWEEFQLRFGAGTGKVYRRGRTDFYGAIYRDVFDEVYRIGKYAEEGEG